MFQYVVLFSEVWCDSLTGSLGINESWNDLQE